MSVAHEPRRRIAYALGYLLMAAAGAASAWWPAPPSVKTATLGAGALIYVWTAFLFVGGLCSFAGAITDRWVGEYIGLPLLMAVFGVYSLAALSTSLAAGKPASVAGGLALGAIACIITGRWRELVIVRRNATAPPPVKGGPHGNT